MYISLADLPEFVLKSIFENCALRSIFILRKVSHSFRNFIDDVKPCTGIHKIGIIVNLNAITLRITTSTDHYHIKYQNQGRGCSISTRILLPLPYVTRVQSGPSTTVGPPPLPTSSTKVEKSNESFWEGVDFVEKCFEDFKTILALQTTVIQELHVNLEGMRLNMFPTRGQRARSWAPLPILLESEDDFLPRVMENLQLVLKDRPFILKVDTLRLDVGSHNQILQVLPYMDPKYLKSIYTQNTRSVADGGFEILEIVKLEQFKKAQQLHLTSFVASAPIEHFSHFLNSSFSLETVSCEDLKKLKEVFFYCEKFWRFKTYYKSFHGKEDLLEAFGDAECGPEWFFWKFSIPGSDQALFLNVVFCHPHTVCFTRCSKFSPPQKGCVNCVYI